MMSLLLKCNSQEDSGCIQSTMIPGEYNQSINQSMRKNSMHWCTTEGGRTVSYLNNKEYLQADNYKTIHWSAGTNSFCLVQRNIWKSPRSTKRSGRALSPAIVTNNAFISREDISYVVCEKASSPPMPSLLPYTIPPRHLPSYKILNTVTHPSKP